MIDRREFTKRIFAIGAGFTAAGLLVRQSPIIIRPQHQDLLRTLATQSAEWGGIFGPQVDDLAPPLPPDVMAERQMHVAWMDNYRKPPMGPLYISGDVLRKIERGDLNLGEFGA